MVALRVFKLYVKAGVFAGRAASDVFEAFCIFGIGAVTAGVCAIGELTPTVEILSGSAAADPPLLLLLAPAALRLLAVIGDGVGRARDAGGVAVRADF